MPNTFLYKVEFIDNDFYTNTYNTAFLAEWNALDDAQKERFIELASMRIKSLASRPFVDLDDLEQEQADGVKIAVSRLIDYWMEYGLDLNRISGSISMGSYSASQTVPSDPDYVPKHVFDTLQDVGLYAPVGFITDDIYRADDDRSVTYGVRFKTLERIKEVSLDKTTAEEANKALSIPTVGKVLEDIRDAKLSPFVIIGQVTGPAGVTTFPTAAEINDLFQNNALQLDDGTILVPALTGAANERLPLANEAIRIILEDKNQEISDFDGATWFIDGKKNAQNAAVKANTDAIAILNGNTQERAMKAVEADLRYLRTDGSNAMGAGYVSSDALDVVVKQELDSEIAGLKATTDTNSSELINVKSRLDLAEPKIDSNSDGVTDYFDNKSDFVRLQDIQGAIDVTADIAGTESGSDVTYDLSGLDLSKLTADKLAVFQFKANNGTDPSEYVSDSYNNSTATPNVLLGEDVNVLSTAALLTVSGLGNADRDTLINDYKLTLVSQISGAAGAGVDQTARDEAAKAQATATDAKNNSTTNTANITANTTAIALKQAKTDTSLQTTAKTIAAAINEVKVGADIATKIGKLKTSDGDDLSTTTEVIQTVKSNPVKDLTNLTTQDEVFKAVEAGDIVKMSIAGNVYDAVVESKTTTVATLYGLYYAWGEINLYVSIINSGNNNKFSLSHYTPKTDNSAATKKYVDDSQTIKDLTHLTTQDEIYNAVEEQKHYIVKTVNNEPAVFICNYKDKSEVFLTGFVTKKGSSILYPVYLDLKSGDKGVLTALEAPINGYATKKYADDLLSTDMVVTFDDGTGETFKLGK